MDSAVDLAALMLMGPGRVRALGRFEGGCKEDGGREDEDEEWTAEDDGWGRLREGDDASLFFRPAFSARNR